jgi:sulfate transport system permease protein
LSLVVLIPVVAVATQALHDGWSAFWATITQPETAAALKLTFLSAGVVVVLNTAAGTVIAWVLVRDEFPGKKALSAIIDLPFALPTIVAGLTLLSLYGPDSPVHLDAQGTIFGVWLALGFVTLPFSVRSVQPVLEELDKETEEAAASLGASSRVILRRVILPSMAPAMLSGAALAFARALGEYGSLVFFADQPFHTEVASIRIFSLYESATGTDLQSPSAVSLVLLVSSLAILLAIGAARRHLVREEVSR